MNSTLAVLKRWMAMDAELNEKDGWGFRVRHFAEDHKVSVATVNRDLRAFRDLGQEMELRYTGPETGGDIREYVWRYAKGIRPLFTANDPRLGGG